ncbi:MAG: MucBP domain-containing protein, partial [Clostridia bacterium]|nr:MucBP domain-containing protein [Clostridia bacterium]
YEITGKIGEAYETEEKEIKYYVLVRSEGNTKGEIKEEEQIVTYYYRKLNFNIGIEKTIETITLNGKNIKIGNKETSKLEIKKEDIKNTEIIVKYNIKVTNTGELGGTSKIVEQIPEGYELAYLPEYWKVMRDETLETNVDLEAGQSKELEVVLRWENKENNLGAKTNIAKIEETKNEANFKDTNEEDNVGKATIVLSIKTGEAVSSIIIVMIMGTLIISSYITIVTIRRKDPEIKDIKFLK